MANKRLALLEKIASQTVLMRDVQQKYFALRKLEATRYPTRESRALLTDSKLIEAELDGMLEELKGMDEEVIEVSKQIDAELDSLVEKTSEPPIDEVYPKPAWDNPKVLGWLSVSANIKDFAERLRGRW